MPVRFRARGLLLGATALMSFATPSFPQGRTVPDETLAVEVPPVRRVVLSSAGLAEYTRVVDGARFADGEERILLPTRLRDIDDALKSFLALGAGVKGAEMRLPSSAVVEDVFAGLPFKPTDVQALDTLLARFPGALVEVSVREGEEVQRRIIGRIMGVSEASSCPQEEACARVLTVRSQQGALERVSLDDTVSVRLRETGVLEAVDRGLDVLATEASADSRTIEATVRATPGSGPVFLSTVFAAPVWRTAYRASVGEDGAADFQAWAVVENATQEDWENVEMTLTSGSPRTLRADLYARRYGARESMGASESLLMMAPMATRSADVAMESAAGAPPMAYGGMGKMDLAEEGVDSLVGARFPLADPVSIRSGEVLAVPFLSGALQSRAVGYGLLDSQGYENPDFVPIPFGPMGERGGAPFGPDGVPIYPKIQDSLTLNSVPLALDVRHTGRARLPSGVLTVYDAQTGFSGDTKVPVMEPGSVHTLVFAQESGAKMGQTLNQDRLIRAIAPGGGVLRFTTDAITTQTVRVEAPAQKPLRMVLDRPLVKDASLTWTGAEGAEETLGDGRRVVRFSRDLAPGEVWMFETVSTRREQAQWDVGNTSEDQFLSLIAQAPDAPTKAWLERAVELRRAVDAAQKMLEQTQERRAAAVADQERRRGMLEVVGAGTPEYDRFLGEILKAEDAITAFDAQKQAQQQALEEARRAFGDHVDA